MPIYEYVCKECENVVSMLVMKPEEDIPPVCEECEEVMEKQLSLGSFVLKGSGWYRDGYQK